VNPILATKGMRINSSRILLVIAKNIPPSGDMKKRVMAPIIPTVVRMDSTSDFGLGGGKLNPI